MHFNRGLAERVSEGGLGGLWSPAPPVNTGLWAGLSVYRADLSTPPNHHYFTPSFGVKSQPRGTETLPLTTSALAIVPCALLLTHLLAPSSGYSSLPGSL